MKALVCTLTLAGAISAMVMSTVSAQSGDGPDADLEHAQHQLEMAEREMERAGRDPEHAFWEQAYAVRQKEDAIQQQERALQTMEKRVQRNVEDAEQETQRRHREHEHAMEQALRADERAQLEIARSAMRDAKVQWRVGGDRSESRELVERLRALEKELANLSEELRREESGSRDDQTRQHPSRALPEFLRTPRPASPRKPRVPRAPRAVKPPRVQLFRLKSDSVCSDADCDDCDTFVVNPDVHKILFSTRGDGDHANGLYSVFSSGNGQNFALSGPKTDDSCNYSVDVDTDGVTVYQIDGSSGRKVIYRHRGSDGGGTTVIDVPEIRAPATAPLIYKFEISDVPDCDFDMDEFVFPVIDVAPSEVFEVEEPQYEFLFPTPEPAQAESTVGTTDDSTETPAAVRVAYTEPGAPGPTTEADLLNELVDLMQGLKNDMGSLKADIRSLHAEIEAAVPN